MKRTVEKRVLEAEEKVAKFPFFAERALTRTGKKWIGIQRQSLSAKLKTKSKTEKIVKQLETPGIATKSFRRLLFSQHGQ